MDFDFDDLNDAELLHETFDVGRIPSGGARDRTTPTVEFVLDGVLTLDNEEEIVLRETDEVRNKELRVAPMRLGTATDFLAIPVTETAEIVQLEVSPSVHRVMTPAPREKVYTICGPNKYGNRFALTCADVLDVGFNIRSFVASVKLQAHLEAWFLLNDNELDIQVAGWSKLEAVLGLNRFNGKTMLRAILASWSLSTLKLPFRRFVFTYDPKRKAARRSLECVFRFDPDRSSIFRGILEFRSQDGIVGRFAFCGFPRETYSFRFLSFNARVCKEGNKFNVLPFAPVDPALTPGKIINC
jgi:hypothetical protein